MIRGMMHFKCPKCGKVFLAPDVEYCATVFSHPMNCPACKTPSPPLFADKLYEKLGIIKKEGK